MWTALLSDQLTRPLQDWQIAQLMAALKLSRLSWSPAKEDSWTDLAGYAACGAECALWDSNPAEVAAAPGVKPAEPDCFIALVIGGELGAKVQIR
jgi:hypothetical protein